MTGIQITERNFQTLNMTLKIDQLLLQRYQKKRYVWDYDIQYKIHNKIKSFKGMIGLQKYCYFSTILIGFMLIYPLLLLTD